MHTYLRHLTPLWLLPLLCILTACQSTAPRGLTVGNPYAVEGKTYYPEYDPTYDKIGLASWYGPGFHGKRTASGEVYNQNDLTAAHPTLPMPSLVRVTNLANGKSIIVRINDRGPFKSNRIIDLSKKSAEKLGMPSTSQVRVQFLKKETEEYLASLDDGGKSLKKMAELNAKVERDRNQSIMRSTEPSGQIVEADVANSHRGETVHEAAPVTSVASADLAQPGASASKEVILVQAQPEASAPKASEEAPEEVAATPVQAFSPPTVAKHKVAEAASPASGKFYIQAGSFSAEENAQKLSSRLSEVGPVDVARVDIGEKTWWRVRLGPFAAQEEATEALNKVLEANVPDARIIHL